jgi:hypothetical protein
MVVAGFDSVKWSRDLVLHSLINRQNRVVHEKMIYWNLIEWLKELGEQNGEDRKMVSRS